MSQIRFATDEYMVLTGWDRPCQMHFLVVDKTDLEVGRQTIYTNLDDKSLPFPGSMTAEQVVAKLDELKIPRPKTLEALLTSHQRQDLGNVIVEMGLSKGVWLTL